MMGRSISDETGVGVLDVVGGMLARISGAACGDDVKSTSNIRDGGAVDLLESVIVMGSVDTGLSE